MRGLNPDHLTAFAQVVELGSFSAAAERLRLTQPAVSQQVRQLEQRLGLRLIERVGRRAAPTAAGAELLVHSRRIDAAVTAALEAMGRHAGGEVGRVRLGTGATACIYLLPPILRRLRQEFPGLEMTVSTGNTADIVRAVEDNAIDLGLVTLPAAGRMLDVTPVLDDEFVAIAAADDDRLPARVTPAALAALPVLLYEPGGNTRRIVDEWFARTGIDLKPVMALGSVKAIKELVAAGLGCSVVPSMAVSRPAARPRIIARPLSPRLSRKLAIVMRRDKPLHRGLREMVTALQRLSSG
ncbi:MAG: LysR family transcriptional regulator [Rhodospirillaceae bacterium]|nr:LysR family transcriptional regulator [Rhodospirillaceae bacterium]